MQDVGIWNYTLIRISILIHILVFIVSCSATPHPPTTVSIALVCNAFLNSWCWMELHAIFALSDSGINTLLLCAEPVSFWHGLESGVTTSAVQTESLGDRTVRTSSLSHLLRLVCIYLHWHLDAIIYIWCSTTLDLYFEPSQRFPTTVTTCHGWASNEQVCAKLALPATAQHRDEAFWGQVRSWLILQCVCVGRRKWDIADA